MTHVMLENPKERILDELRKAWQERHEGHEGKARVCARRAAGWAVGELYRRRALTADVPSSVIGLLAWFRELEEVSPDLREAANRLTRRVRLDHTLPHAQDPLDDAEQIVRAILGEEIA